jgi:hypothetical protein
MASLHVQRTYTGTNLWLQWVLANIVGWATGWAIFAVCADTIPMVGHPVGFIVGGATVGVLQWLVLRRVVDRAGWSILASSLGLTVGFIGGWALGGPPFDFLLAFVLVGLLNGIVQWLALRQRSDRAGWWVLASTIGFALGGAAAFAVAMTIGDAVSAAFGGEVIGFAAVVAVMGLVGGALGSAGSGVVLARLLEASAASAQRA